MLYHFLQRDVLLAQKIEAKAHQIINQVTILSTLVIDLLTFFLNICVN